MSTLLLPLQFRPIPSCLSLRGDKPRTGEGRASWRGGEGGYAATWRSWANMVRKATPPPTIFSGGFRHFSFVSFQQPSSHITFKMCSRISVIWQSTQGDESLLLAVSFPLLLERVLARDRAEKQFTFLLGSNLTYFKLLFTLFQAIGFLMLLMGERPFAQRSFSASSHHKAFSFSPHCWAFYTHFPFSSLCSLSSPVPSLLVIFSPPPFSFLFVRISRKLEN